MELSLLITMVGVGGSLGGGVATATATWLLHRPAELAQTSASRADIGERLRDRLDKQDGTIEDLRATVDQLRQQSADQHTAHRQELDALSVRHQQELVERNQLIASQQLVLVQQAAQIKGLEEQVATLRDFSEKWQRAAEDGRATMREAVLSAVSSSSPPPPKPPAGDA